jgi:hypothetical protein
MRGAGPKGRSKGESRGDALPFPAESSGMAGNVASTWTIDDWFYTMIYIYIYIWSTVREARYAVDVAFR